MRLCIPLAAEVLVSTELEVNVDAAGFLLFAKVVGEEAAATEDVASETLSETDENFKGAEEARGLVDAATVPWVRLPAG